MTGLTCTLVTLGDDGVHCLITVRAEVVLGKPGDLAEVVTRYREHGGAFPLQQVAGGWVRDGGLSLRRRVTVSPPHRRLRPVNKQVFQIIIIFVLLMYSYLYKYQALWLGSWRRNTRLDKELRKDNNSNANSSTSLVSTSKSTSLNKSQLSLFYVFQEAHAVYIFLASHVKMEN